MRTRHRPVEVHEDGNGAVIKCLCGWSTKPHRWIEDAWDEYDDHTMKD